jgi:hypothetical protein
MSPVPSLQNGRAPPQHAGKLDVRPPQHVSPVLQHVRDIHEPDWHTNTSSAQPPHAAQQLFAAQQE